MEGKNNIYYKIDTEHNYKIYKNTYGGKDYFQIMVEQKNFDGTKTKYYKKVRFSKITPPENGDIIRIKWGFENLFPNKNDKYNPVSELMIMDYEKVENSEINENKAYQEFQTTLNENEIDDELGF